MTQQIWKYSLKSDLSAIAMPVGAEILHLTLFKGIPTIWALVDPDADLEIRTFETVPTGHVIENELIERREYVGSYEVWEINALVIKHVFEQLLK